MKHLLLALLVNISTVCVAQTFYSITNDTYAVYGLIGDTKPVSPPDNCYFVEVNTNKTFVSAGGLWVLVGIGVDSIATRLAIVTDSLATALAISIAATYAPKANATFTGTFATAAGAIANAALANGAVANLSGTNTGDQTSIVGITGTFAQFNTAVTDAELARTNAANTFTGVQTMTSPAITTPTGIVKGDVGLGNVDNTSNATERAASAVLSTKTIATFNYAADAGSNDTYVIALSPALAAYAAGTVIFFKANTVNTGAASINVNSLGAKTIVKRVSTTLANGDIPALALCMLLYDGTNFVLLNPVVN